MQRVMDSKVESALNETLQPYQEAPRGSEKQYKWLRLLRVAEGNGAHLVVSPDKPDMVRIVITQAGTKISYDVQMSLPRLQVQADYHYGVNFMARADSPRSIGCGFAKGHAPWSNLGWYHQVQLTSQWQSFEESFVATEDENNARIHFDVGVSDIAV